MQVIPDQRNSKTTALMLLVIALLLLYLLFFHWFVVRHIEYADEIGELRTQLERFENVAAQRESLQVRLNEVRNSKGDVDLFLEYPSFDEAAAAMSGDIGDMVRTLADDSCQIVSRVRVKVTPSVRYTHVRPLLKSG